MSTFELFEAEREMLGTEYLLDAIAQALSTDELQACLSYINRCNDLNIAQ